jgi:hypothetical protein
MLLAPGRRACFMRWSCGRVACRHAARARRRAGRAWRSRYACGPGCSRRSGPRSRAPAGRLSPDRGTWIRAKTATFGAMLTAATVRNPPPTHVRRPDIRGVVSGGRFFAESAVRGRAEGGFEPSVVGRMWPGLLLPAGYRQLPDGRDRVGEGLQAVADRDADVLNAAVLQLGQHLQPELGALTAAPAHNPRMSRSPRTVTPTTT